MQKSQPLPLQQSKPQRAESGTTRVLKSAPEHLATQQSHLKHALGAGKAAEGCDDENDYSRRPSKAGRQGAEQAEAPRKDEQPVGPVASHLPRVLHRPHDGKVPAVRDEKKQSIERHQSNTGHRNSNKEIDVTVFG